MRSDDIDEMNVGPSRHRWDDFFIGITGAGIKPGIHGAGEGPEYSKIVADHKTKSIVPGTLIILPTFLIHETCN